MPYQQKFLQPLLVLVVAGFLAGCSGDSSGNAVTTASSTPAVTPQSGVQNESTDSAVPQNAIQNDAPDTTAIPFCSKAFVDSDGDGWGWENQQTCKVRSDVASDKTEQGSNATTASGDDLPVGILYFLWHCKATSNSTQYNITEVLNGQSDWASRGTFHWWDEPDAGYYCLGDRPDLITQHLIQLRDAGIDFLVLDSTNHPNTASFDAENFILKSLRPLLEAASSIPNAPRIVPWVPFTNDNDGTRNERTNACNSNNNSTKCKTLQQSQPMYQHFVDLLTNEFPQLAFHYQGKPLLLETANDNKYPRSETDIVRLKLQNDWSVERMWGLQTTNDEWSFLSTCSNPVDFFESNGWSAEGCNQPVNAGNQISVSAAYQYTYISEPFTEDTNTFSGFTGGMPKFYGRTMAQQFRVAFEERDRQPLVLLTGWNEWIAQRFERNGRTSFVDLYDDTRNRDIEPGGVSGDLYYYLMRDLITGYRNHKPFSFEDYFLTKSSILDTDYYWDAHTDLQSVFNKEDEIGLTNHWLTTGLQEGRRPSIAFNANYYRNNYPDLVNAGITTAEALLNHFLNAGFQEGRRGSADFNAPSYLSRYPEIVNAYGNNGYYKSYKHYVAVGQFVNHNARP